MHVFKSKSHIKHRIYFLHQIENWLINQDLLSVKLLYKVYYVHNITLQLIGKFKILCIVSGACYNIIHSQQFDIL